MTPGSKSCERCHDVVYLLIVDAADTAPRGVELLSLGRRRCDGGSRDRADLAISTPRRRPSAKASPDGNGLAYIVDCQRGTCAQPRPAHGLDSLATAEFSGKDCAGADRCDDPRLASLWMAARRGAATGAVLVYVNPRQQSHRLERSVEPTAKTCPDVTEALISRISASLGATVRDVSTTGGVTEPRASLAGCARARVAHDCVGCGDEFRGPPPGAQQLELAVRLDPKLTPPHGRTWVHWRRTDFWPSRSWAHSQDLPQAIADVKHAIALDPLLASSWRIAVLNNRLGPKP